MNGSIPPRRSRTAARGDWAVERVTGSSGDSIDRVAVRRNVRRLLLFVALPVVAAGFAGALVGVLVAGDEHGGRADRHPVLGVVVVVGLPLLVVALCFLILRPIMRRSSFQAVMRFGWSERRAVYKTVKAGRPLTDRDVRESSSPVSGPIG
jgi:hypothetical protein